ncbi:hypothetical protein T11_12543 [Trichinella zimbabwensis]|uniref:Uncharacterized protein n=1 Tax=Trichinella zimbabwensis TaxID=268475 RepID=A0A0V1GVV9_9BILA|nr:hypothetical protein T11_12543 [Trichinella zimbabwensis]
MTTTWHVIEHLIGSWDELSSEVIRNSAKHSGLLPKQEDSEVLTGETETDDSGDNPYKAEENTGVHEPFELEKAVLKMIR